MIHRLCFPALIFYFAFIVGCAAPTIVKIKSPEGSSPIEIQKLPTGGELVLVQDNSVPILDMAVIVKKGASSDPMAQSGLSELMLNTWLENPILSEKFASIGGAHSHDLTNDYFVIGGRTLSTKREEYLKLFFDLLSHPQFNQKVFDYKKQQALSLIRRLPDDADMLCDVAFREYIYGSHPYGRAPYGNEEDLQKITLSQIVKKYETIISPRQMIFLLSGDFDEQFKKDFIAKISEFKNHPSYDVHRPRPPAIRNIQILLVDKPDVSQAQIDIGQFSVTRKDPDYVKLDIAQNVLGGGFTSRLNQKLRVEKGLVYDIHTDLDTDVFESVFKISTSSKNSNIEKVIAATLSTYKDFVDNGITQEELEIAQNSIQGRLLRTVEAPDSHVIWLASQRFYDTNVSTVNDAVAEIQGISVSQVNKAIKNHMNSGNLKIVVVAPAKVALKPLEKFGLVEIKKATDY